MRQLFTLPLAILCLSSCELKQYDDTSWDKVEITREDDLTEKLGYCDVHIEGSGIYYEREGNRCVAKVKE